MTLRKVCIAVLTLVALLLTPDVSAAQGALGSLVGTVRDEQNAVLPGATVRLSSPATGLEQNVTTDQAGAFSFPQLQPGVYELAVSLSGFRTRTYAGIVINVGVQYALAVQLSLGQVQETVTVVTGETVIATTPEVVGTVQQRQVLDIPLLNRDITNLIKLQAGVAGIINRTNTVINGGRPTWTQVTLDGVNVQDNYIRTNALDFLPNRLTSDNVAEFSITSAVAGADTAGGATAMRMVTPSGSNRFRGSVYEFNRDAALAANSYFNRRTGVAKPGLERNQFGGRIGGPIVKNRVFFFFNAELLRQKTQSPQNVTIPANADFIDGAYRYVGLDGVVRAVNLMQLTGLPIDQRVRSEMLSKLPPASSVNNFDVGNSSAARLLNTAGYRFNQTVLANRDQTTSRVDVNLGSSQALEMVYASSKDVADRPDLDYISPNRPLTYTLSTQHRFAAAWRKTLGFNIQNELRFGGNLSVVSFESDWDYSSGLLFLPNAGLTNPVGGYGTGSGFQPQGRNVNTYQLTDSATLLKGRHEIQIGGNWQRNRVNPYNYAGQFPVIAFGFSSAAPTSVQLSSAQFPGGISATDLNTANSIAAMIGGVASSSGVTFQVRDTTSGYVPGIPSEQTYTLDNVALYAQDNWRWKPNFTIRAGLKWEYYSPLREDDNLGFLPVTDGRPIRDVMLSPATTLTFANGGFYKKDLNNFGPTAGFAWDIAGDGRTIVRGGYSLTFVNEDTVTVGAGVGRGNSGLSTSATLSGLYNTVSAGVPVPATPTFLSTRTLANQLALSATSVLWGIDPDIRSPKVHQVSVGVQRELWDSTAVEARYVGTFGRDIWRGLDLNQLTISPEFLADFGRGRSNGFLAQAAGLPFSPVFNPNVPGSQALTVLPSFGLLTNATVVNAFLTNQVAGVADFYMSQRVAGALAAFMPNPGTYAANVVLNGAFNDYNSLQLEARRRLSAGLFGQVNYTLSQTNTDSAGDGQNRFEAFLDNDRPALSIGRSNFHQTHVVNANAIYELPFGEGRRWLSRGGLINGLVGNWQVSTIVAWQSGSPLSIYSGRGTFNRPGRSACALPTSCNTALSTLSPAEIQKLLGVYFHTDGNIYWIDPKVIDPTTGRAVGPDTLGNTPGFAGQVFFNPVAGQVGNLPIMAFDGPSQTRIDLAVSKRIAIGRTRFEIKGEAFNLFDKPSFYRGDMDINSTQFGRLTSVNVASRIIQISARLDF